MIAALSITLIIVVILLMSALLRIYRMQEQLILLDKEQHTQNMDIIDLLKYRAQSTETLLQHVEVLQYLIDQDPNLSSKKVIYPSIVGEA